MLLLQSPALLYPLLPFPENTHSLLGDPSLLNIWLVSSPLNPLPFPPPLIRPLRASHVIFLFNNQPLKTPGRGTKDEPNIEAAIIARRSATRFFQSKGPYGWNRQMLLSFCSPCFLKKPNCISLFVCVGGSRFSETHRDTKQRPPYRNRLTRLLHKLPHWTGVIVTAKQSWLLYISLLYFYTLSIYLCESQTSGTTVFQYRSYKLLKSVFKKSM